MFCGTTAHTANLNLDTKKSPKNGAAETASSAQILEGVGQGRAFVLDLSNFY